LPSRPGSHQHALFGSSLVHELTLPAATCGNPMTYTVNGKQFIAVSIGSRTAPAELIALALP